MTDEALLARDGDVLVVSYPEVKIPLATKFANVTVGGMIYTRHLVAGENVQVQQERIYAFLKRMAEADAREKVRIWTEELAPRPAHPHNAPVSQPEPRVVIAPAAVGANPPPLPSKTAAPRPDVAPVVTSRIQPSLPKPVRR